VKIDVVALILNFNQLFDNRVAVCDVARTQRQAHLIILARSAQTVNAGNACDYKRVPPLEKRTGCRVTQLVDFVVYAHFLFDVKVARGYIGLGHIIIVIGNEKLHPVVREKLPEFVAQLCGKRLVVTNHQCGTVCFGNNIRHSKSLSAAGDAPEHLCAQTVFQTLGKAFYCLRLVPRRLVFAYKLEIHSSVSVKTQAPPLFRW